MNDADSPDQSTLPAPVEPAEIPAVVESIAAEVPQLASTEGWQTVDFPGVMSVDAIPLSPVAERLHSDGWSQTEALSTAVPQGVIHYSDAAISAAVSYSAATPMGTGEPTQAHLQQLLQELERSHQTAQRQQILVETLTEQLGSSQERIAQLERDCALTQQRHNEQVQQVLQAESNCRDLRLRLHRQQQQTLQFKAALEKCLEMPTVYSNPTMPGVAVTSEAPMSDVLAALLPKNPPVKPWSLTEKASQDPTDQTDQSRSLLKLLNHGSLLQDGGTALAPELTQERSKAQAAALFNDSLADCETMPADPSALLDSDDPQFVTHLMQLIFPTTVDESSYLAADALQSEPLLDLSSVAEADLEAERAEATNLPTLDVASAVTFISPDRPSDWATASLETASEENQSDTASASPNAIASPSSNPLPDDTSTDPLWDHLATLIDPQLPAEQVKPAVADAIDLPGAIAPAQASLALPAAPNLVPLEERLLPSLPTSTTAIPPIFVADVDSPIAASSSDDSATTVQSGQTGWTWRDRLVSAGKMARAADVEAAQPAKLLALSVAAGQQAVQSPESVSSPTPLTPKAVAVPPSPIVYPQRATKKLASLAAVDLPTFPKR